VYVVDNGSQKIRKITSSGVVTTLAGSGDYGSADGTGTTASFSSPTGVAVDESGNVYVADNSSNIRKITASGAVTTISGSGASQALCIDQNGNIYTSSNNKILKFNPSISGLAEVNQISAGENHSLALKSDGTVFGWGSNANGKIDVPTWINDFAQVSAGGNHSLALRREGEIWGWGDNTHEQTWSSKILNLNRVVQVAAGGTHSLALTSFGSVVAWGNNANGQTSVPAGYTQASFGKRLGLAVYGSGNNSIIYVADTDNKKIRKITANGTVLTLAGSGEYGSDDGIGAAASFREPQGVTVDNSGNVYVADCNTIRKITANGTVTTVAGSADYWGSEDGLLTSATFGWNAGGIAVDSDGTIYVTDSSNNKIRKITSLGVTTLAGSGQTGAVDGNGISASFNDPYSLAVYGSGNSAIVYVADYKNNKIRKITANGTVTTFAGSVTPGFADGNVTAARFDHPESIAVDSGGNVYVADSANCKVRKITPAGVVTTLAGSGFYASTDGTGVAASFRYPDGIVADINGNIYTAEEKKIRKVTTAGAVTTFAGAETHGSQDGVATMAAGNKITQIAAGGSHSLALTSSGTVIAWGDNSSGQCVVPTGLTGVVQIAAGKAHSMAIKSNGTVVAWGNNADGQNTIPTTGMTLYPIQVSAGGAHSLALMASGPLGAPEITAQPVSLLQRYAGSNATFSVTASGANLTYQWYRNGSSVAGATESTFITIAGVNTRGNYTVQVSNSLGSATSVPATLSLRPAAEWVWANTGPGEPVQSGDSVTFAVDNVTGPEGTISYQWLKNGKALAGKTSSTLTLDPVSVGDSGSYTLAIRTSAGKIVTESQNLVVQDSGTLVYKILATGSKINGASKTSTGLSGYFVRDRFDGDSHIVWMNSKTKKYSFETRTDITEKSTGPFAGSTSVLRAHQENDSDEEEMLWISGTDSLIRLDSSRQTMAPATLSGQINSTFAEESTLIEMLKITLMLDKVQTLKALTTDENNATTTATRLLQEIETKGYQSE
jgi:sugar lactone lactonase YvrE